VQDITGTGGVSGDAAGGASAAVEDELAAMNEIVLSKPKNLMKLAENPTESARLRMAPLIILLFQADRAINHQQQAIRQMPDCNRMPTECRSVANRQIAMEVTDALKPMIESPLRR